jgi:hypothetical protein
MMRLWGFLPVPAKRFHDSQFDDQIDRLDDANLLFLFLGKFHRIGRGAIRVIKYKS